MAFVPHGCRYCDYGNRSSSTCGIHADRLLPDFRRARCPQSGPSRDGIHHPLEIIYVARSALARGIPWNQPQVSASRRRVLEEFSTYIYVIFPSTPHNPYWQRCRPQWWLGHVTRIAALLERDQDIRAMRRYVADVHNIAELMMHDVQYVEPPHYAGMPVPPAVNINVGGIQAIGVRGAGGDVGVGNRGVRNVGAIAQDGGVVGRGRVNVNHVNDDEDDYDLPAPPVPGPRARQAPVVIEISSDPIVEPEAPVPAPVQLRPEELVLFTLSVDVLGSSVVVPVTVEMELGDGIEAAVRGSVLRGMDPAAVQFVGPGGGVWGEHRWIELWNLSMAGRPGPWPVALVARGA